MPIGERLTVRFGPFEFDPLSGELFKNSRKLKLEGQPLQVLALLLEKPGTLVTREEICKRLWPADTFVDSERILNADIWKLRQALGDNADSPHYIETLPKRGYRFIGQELPLKPSPIVPASKPHLTLPIVIVLIAAGILISLGLTYWLRRSQSPRIVGTSRLTHTGVQKSRALPVWCFLATDGARVYFQERRTAGSWAISQVSVNGGETSDVSSPSSGYQCLQDMKGSELLINIYSTQQGWTAWGIPVPAGSPRKLPVPIGQNWAMWSRDGKRLFYTSNNDQQFNRLDLESGTSVRLFNAPDITYPRLSPDGRRLRFTSLVASAGTLEYLKERTIWEANTDGSNLHRLYPEIMQNASFGDWTPDGKLFFFYRHRGSSSTLWVMREQKDLLSHRPKPTLLYAGPLELHSPIASKDGKKLFVIGSDLKAELSAFDKRTQQFVPLLSGIPACFVDFSPDGEWVAYVTYPDGNLWRSRVDGTEKRQLTFPPMGVILPRWSPDGKLIVFSDWYSGEHYKIYAISPEGGSPGLLLTGDFQPSDPTWSPDGESIAYGSCGGCPSREIRVFDLKSGTSRSIPGSAGFFSPRWSPDGRFLVALTAKSQGLVLFDFQTGKWRVLTNSNVINFSFPSWSRDSRYVYVQGAAEGIARFNVSSGKVEPVASLKNVRTTAVRFRMLGWFGLTPDDRIMILRDTGTEDIYALDLEY